MPTSAPGSETGASRRERGFTLIELMVVVTLIAVARATVVLSIRDPAATRLDQEAARLVALLESARSEARAAGLEAGWQPQTGASAADGFEFVGLPSTLHLPTRWLTPEVTADVTGARAVVLGPEPLIGAQQIVLHLNGQSLVLSTDGLGPFVAQAPSVDPVHP